MLSIIVLEDDALQRHRVGRLLDEAVEESKAVVDGITFYEQGQELLDTDRDSGNPWFIFWILTSRIRPSRD